MEAIRPVTPLAPVVAVDTPARPGAPVAETGGATQARSLDPAVSIDLSPDASSAAKSDPARERHGYERDPDTRTLVFRVTDTKSGDVIVQIPNEIVLKARVYARQDSATIGEQVEKLA